MNYQEFFENQHIQILKDLKKLELGDGTEKKKKEILRFKKESEELMKKSLGPNKMNYQEFFEKSEELIG